MLIVVSDFHLMDGTAGAHHVEPGVFRSTMNDLAAHAHEAKANDITLVFLGDVYDLIRTERWFDLPPDERPWGATPSSKALFDIFEGVVDNNAETFALLAGSLVDEFGFPVEPKRVYIPGNHDALVNEHPYLRRRVRETLGMPEGDEPFPGTCSTRSTASSRVTATSGTGSTSKAARRTRPASCSFRKRTTGRCRSAT